jgi:hypothetical protein
MIKLWLHAWNALRKTCGIGSPDNYLHNAPFTKKRIEAMKQQKRLKDSDIYRMFSGKGKEDVVC